VGVDCREIDRLSESGEGAFVNNHYLGVADDSEEEWAVARENAAAWRRALLLAIEVQIGDFEQEEATQWSLEGG
jgi:hypothetical protein